MIPIQIEVTEDDRNFRVIQSEVAELTPANIRQAMKNAELKGDEYIYQVCAPVEGCELPQPVYDFFNGFRIYFEEKE